MAKDGQKTESLGAFTGAKLLKKPESHWKEFDAIAAQAKTVNDKHEQTKEKVRGFFKKLLNLPDDAVIDFTRNGDKISVYRILQPAKGKRGGGNNLDDLL